MSLDFNLGAPILCPQYRILFQRATASLPDKRPLGPFQGHWAYQGSFDLSYSSHLRLWGALVDEFGEKEAVNILKKALNRLADKYQHRAKESRYIPITRTH